MPYGITRFPEERHNALERRFRGGNTVSVDLMLDESGENYNFVVKSDGVPVGMGVISNEGLSIEETQAKILKLSNVKALLEMF